MTSAYLTSDRELRVYNRNKQHDPIATPKEEKKLLKKLGFTWDKHNKSWCLYNATNEAINIIKSFVEIKIY